MTSTTVWLDDDRPAANGLRHPWQQSTGAWLYPTEHFLTTFAAADEATQDAMLTWQREHGATHMFVELCVTPSPWQPMGFDGAADIPRCRRILERVIAADLASIVSFIGHSYYRDRLGSVTRLCSALEELTEGTEDLFSWCLAMLEIDELFIQDNDRRAIIQAMRRKTSKPIGVHCLPMEAPYRTEIRAVDPPTIAALQFGFRRVATQQSLGQWLITDEAKGAVAATIRRLSPYGCETMSFEHSIPFIRADQPSAWLPARTLEDARQIGQQLLAEGCCSDFSGAAR